MYQKQRDFGVSDMAENKAQFLARIGQPVGSRGRALKYTPEHCDRIIMLAQQGEFPETWANELGVTLETFRLWRRDHPEFGEAIIMAHQYLLAHWTRFLAANLTNPNAKPKLFALLLRRFPAIYGRDPIDLANWISNDGEPDLSKGTDKPEDLSGLTDQELMERLDVLHRRRQATRG